MKANNIVRSLKLLGASLLAPWLLTGAAQADSAILPSLESLTGDSDYSAFLQPGVDVELRRLALRKLFHSEKFAGLDPLDPDRMDFAAHLPLGDTVTADMRFQAERLMDSPLECLAMTASSAPPTGAQEEDC